MTRFHLFGIPVTIDFHPPPFDRGEEVEREDGVPGVVTHFDGDEGYNNGGESDIWVEFEDGLQTWMYPDEVRKKRT